MRHRFRFLALVVACAAVGAAASAQVYTRGLYGSGVGYTTPTFRVEDVPPVVFAGVNACRTNGPDDAVRVWVKNGPLEGGSQAASQATYLHQAGDFYGQLQGFEVADVRQPTPHVRILFGVLNYKKGPVFARFTLYRTEENGWVTTNFYFNTEIGQVFPAELD